jgi:hypothetical protein
VDGHLRVLVLLLLDVILDAEAEEGGAATLLANVEARVSVVACKANERGKGGGGVLSSAMAERVDTHACTDTAQEKEK